MQYGSGRVLLPESWVIERKHVDWDITRSPLHTWDFSFGLASRAGSKIRGPSPVGESVMRNDMGRGGAHIIDGYAALSAHYC